jgi:RecA/RadA recombinase
MSAGQRKISRLPISVFQDLITRPSLEERDDDPESIKSTICNRLKRFRIRNNGRNKNKNKHGRGLGISLPTTTACSIKTIGQLLRLSKYTIMLALDPVLTYEEVGIFIERVCNQCAPKPSSVLRLLRSTDADTNSDVYISEYENDGNGIVPRTQQLKERQQNLYDTDSVSFGNKMRQLPTSLPSLDRILRGGVRLATVTELVGRSGVGKTQLAFQLCITAAKFNQGAIYIDTEKKLSLERLREMSEHRRRHTLQEKSRREIEKTIHRNKNGTDVSRYKPRGGNHPIPSNQESYSSSHYDDGGNYDIEDAMATFKPGESVLDNITVHQPGNSEELLNVLDELEYEILIRNQSAGSALSKSGDSEGMNTIGSNKIVQGKYPVRLLIVDSIAAPIRRDFGIGSAPQRAATIFQCAQKLKRLADQLHLAIVVINQAGSDEGSGGISNISHGIGTSNFSGSGSEYQHAPVRAALGRQSVDNDNYNDPSFRQAVQTAPRVIRKISVTKSNTTGFGETHFNITTMGIVEV